MFSGRIRFFPKRRKYSRNLIPAAGVASKLTVDVQITELPVKSESTLP